MSIKTAYKDGECPDCGDSIPEKAENGDSCENCGHVFWENWCGCDQCEPLMIQGVFTHEIGCPNSKKKWVSGEWVRFYDCDICGYDVKEGETCGCYSEEAEDDNNS